MVQGDMTMEGGFLIKEKDAIKRRGLIAFLIENGFRLDENEFRGDQGIIDGSLPIVVKIDDKSYSMMGNVTCAAAAARSGCYISADEFYESFTKKDL